MILISAQSKSSFMTKNALKKRKMRKNAEKKVTIAKKLIFQDKH
jgi:hypothetical protein